MNGERGENKATAQDYYEILGVARGANAATIKFAYRQLVRKHHPDVSEDKAAAEGKLREINAAYSVLSDRGKRASYDRFGHGVAAAGGAENIARVFDMFFGATRNGERESAGKDLRYDAHLTADELVGGTTREIAFRRLVACEACQGSGAQPGTLVSPCDRCAGSGTMRHVRQTPHSVHFTQTTCSLCNGEGQIVSAPCRVCGGRGGTESEEAVTVTIPAGSIDGSVIRLDGGGEAGLRGGPDGDLYVHLIVTGDASMPGEPHMQNGTGRTIFARPVVSAKAAQPHGGLLPSSLRWSWIVATALFALMFGAAIFYAIHRNAAVATQAGGAIAVCAAPSAEQLAADLVRGYTAKTVNSLNLQYITHSDGNPCDMRFSFVPGKAEGAVACDAIVVIVNRLNSISRISEAQLRGVFSGSVRDWSELGEPRAVIVPFAPDPASDEAQTMKSTIFAGLSIDPGVIRRGSSADVTRAVAGADRVSRGAIGLVTFSQAVPAKMIPIAYLPPPNVLTIASGRYPFILTLRLQSESMRDPAATQELIDFARSREGVAIVEKNGLVPREGF